jgi:exodeoxyribonuclease V alpha subunit
LTDKDRQYIHDKGISTIRSHAMNFITARLAPPDPKNDGKQTPMRGHPVFIAQHATATCCCGQLEKWYQIEKGKALDDDEVGYVVNLVMGWIEGQGGRH